ncbi:MAG TPA: hypothetical protein VN739_06120 [Nitrososphaerales archaeon]|jgi:hypothetical protein|nr:hypothetical protein [Nitrososphaerales archaeon]
MKIRFGLIYLAFVLVGALYEAETNHFSGIAFVNYLLTGFLYSSVFFIVFYIAVRIVIYIVGRFR